jgi:hypothetical protein
MLLIVVLWFGISAPLSAVGAYFGSKHGVRFSRLYSDWMTMILLTGCSSPRARQSNTSPNSTVPQVSPSLGKLSITVPMVIV